MKERKWVAGRRGKEKGWQDMREREETGGKYKGGNKCRGEERKQGTGEKRIQKEERKQ